MEKPSQRLCDLKPTKEFLVAIDSDGCVFDAMGIKQRECFCPMMIAYFGLQPVAEAARQCKEFADLFSKTRGANRHKTIARILTELLPSHPMVKERGFKVPRFDHYVKWVHDPNSLLSNEGLRHAIETAQPEAKNQLQIALRWSVRVNEMVAEIVKNVPPFPFVRESLEMIVKRADVIVCSSTPVEAIEREWTEHDIAKYVNLIAGQEMGTKAEHLAVMCEKYERHNILMVGDALGDQKAAETNKVLFFPIDPGDEASSWKCFLQEAFDKFIANAYCGPYEDRLKARFAALLPEHPAWLS
jgi:phosphoglycolate phosphatase-like HAD superfamily hydrolase